MTRSRYRIFSTEHPHFLTCTIVGWLPVFTRPETVQIVYDSWHWLRENRGVQIYGYVILENHLHLVASSNNLAEDIGDFKSFTARKIIDLLEARKAELLLKQLKWNKEKHKTDREYQLWQEGSHPQEIQDDRMMEQKLEYIHNNPVARGFVDETVHWRYSSARDYAGRPGLFPVVTNWR